jgi:hypothetical protein
VREQAKHLRAALAVKLSGFPTPPPPLTFPLSNLKFSHPSSLLIIVPFRLISLFPLRATV